MKKQHLFLSFVLLIGSLILFIGGRANLALAASGEGAGFTVKAQLPDNQADKKASYFDLNVEPGETQELKITVANLDDTAKTLIVRPNSAFTNDNGVIEYSKSNLKKDSSAKYTFSELVSDTQRIELAGRKKKTVTFKLKVPDSGFKGSILGGFYVTPEDDDTAQTESESGGMQLNNKFAMLVGAHLHGEGTAKPDLRMNKVTPKLVNQQPVVLANLQNIQPVGFGNLTVDAKITAKGEDEVLYSRKAKNMQMAPNSNFNYAINLDNKGFQAGDYTLKLTAKANGKTWRFTRDFKITREMTKLNNDASGVEKPDYTWAYIAGAVVLVLVIGGLAYYLGRRKK